MRWWLMLGGVGCVPNGVGFASGRVQLEPGTTSRFNGGAMVFDLVGDASLFHGGEGEPLRTVMVTDRSGGFDCGWAQVSFADADPPRRGVINGSFQDLWWHRGSDVIHSEIFDDRVLGGASGSGGPIATGTVLFDDDAETSGTMTADFGDIAFRAFDCGEI